MSDQYVVRIFLETAPRPRYGQNKSEGGLLVHELDRAKFFTTKINAQLWVARHNLRTCFHKWIDRIDVVTVSQARKEENL